MDSYMDPSVAGYWEMYPTTMPILTRLDAIEAEDSSFADATEVTPDDLVPNRLEYRLAPGDFVTVQIYELYAERTWATRTSRVDVSGVLRVPEIGDVIAAGQSAEELRETLIDAYREIITIPQVDVEIAESGGFQYTVYGFINGTGLYTLRREDLRLLDALALAGGVPTSVEHVYVMRSSPLEERVLPDFQREGGRETGGTPEPTPRGTDPDALLREFDAGGGVSPGVLRQDGEPAIDVDDLRAPRRQDSAPVDIDAVRPGSGGWRYDAATGTWMRTGAGGEMAGDSPLIVDRIIRVPIKALTEGDSRYNIVVRPNDRIYVEGPDSGVVYIEGQINRPGPYNLPAEGMFTLSRLIASAGGFGALAIPERVDITRIVGDNREATIRVNLKAIRNRTEPDIVLKADDHINIGTNFWATPLAVIRNGFRATYGFGFLLDRNFGNDVFGAPPTNVGNGG
jgi:polysaccharide export outer membrane protein